MHKVMKNKYLTLILIVFGLAQVVQAQDGGNQVSIDLKVYRIDVDTDGNETATEVTETKPGDLLEYRLVCTNTGTNGVTSVYPDLGIPDGTKYMEGTASPAITAASLSLRQKNFQQLPLIRRETLPSGLVVSREVPAEEYRQIQWLLPSLGAGESVTLSARVQVIDG